MRRRLVVLRLVLMAAIAILLGTVGGWTWALPWWLAYASLQGLLVLAARRRTRLGYGPVYVVSFLTFAVAGLPSWHMWTALGPIGVAAGTMYLCGMLVQLVASSLAARRLFFASAAPLFAYLIVVPTVALGRHSAVEGVTILLCALALITYLLVLWRGQGDILRALSESRAVAEAASHAKTEFLATISHEIRTPMNAVLGSSELLSRGELAGEQREHVDAIRDAGLVLTQVLNDVLDLSRIEAGKLQVAPTAVDLPSLIHRCAAVWRPRAADAGLTLAIDIAPEARRQVMIDPLRTGQILFNLLSNAIKFTPAGAITLSVALVETADGAGEIRLSVADTGIGIAPEALGRLFTPFEQADGSITRRFGGAGLGLAIGQKLAQIMGGQIAVQSTGGAGSRFTLTLPCALPQAGAGDAPPEPRIVIDGPAPGLRILLAEDHPANQRIVDHFLRPLNADLTIVADGQAAVDAAATQVFDVILMDLQMPVMDGLEATRRIRADPGPNRDAPILALTANAMDSHRQACVAAGMNGHIVKPIDARLLLSTVLSVGLARQEKLAAG